jgi:hypothetical protein
MKQSAKRLEASRCLKTNGKGGAWCFHHCVGNSIVTAAACGELGVAVAARTAKGQSCTYVMVIE